MSIWNIYSIWSYLVQQDEEIEIFGQPSIGNPTKVKKIDRLGATPTCILYLEEDSKVSITQALYVLH